MKLSEIRATLKEIGVWPAKALGQNFLHDQNLARWIVDQAKITPADYVIEIGPGLGALTKFILERGAHVLAIEKDARLAKFLRSRFSDERLEIVNTDALQFDPRVLFAHRRVKLIRLGFSQRRKQLRKLLREYARDWNTLASCLTIDPNARAEELSLLQWIALANCIAPPPSLGMRSTPNERFPVVDKNDRIRGYASRSEVHGNNLRHRAVHILIFNQVGDIYLQLRSRWKDRHPLKC